jgi:transcriptional regulator with XRE-family HTH domain
MPRKKPTRLLPPPPTPAQAWFTLQLARGIKAEDLAAQLGCSAPELSRYRSGVRAVARSHLARLVELSGLTVGEAAMVPGAARKRGPGRRPSAKVPELVHSGPLVMVRTGLPAVALQRISAPLVESPAPVDNSQLSGGATFERGTLSMDRVRLCVALGLNPGATWRDFLSQDAQPFEEYAGTVAAQVAEVEATAVQTRVPGPVAGAPAAVPQAELYAHLGPIVRGPDHRPPVVIGEPPRLQHYPQPVAHGEPGK